MVNCDERNNLKIELLSKKQVEHQDLEILSLTTLQRHEEARAGDHRGVGELRFREYQVSCRLRYGAHRKTAS